MGPVGIGFGVATVAVVGLSAWAAPRIGHRDVLIASAILACAWTVSNLRRNLLPEVDPAMLYLVVDFASGLFVMTLYSRRPEAWKAILAVLLLAQIADHAWLLSGERAADQKRFYILILNLLFAAQLLTVASPGGRHVAEVVGNWLRPALGTAAGAGVHRRPGPRDRVGRPARRE